MPPYPWLISDKLNTANTEKKISTMQTLGVPYPDGYDKDTLNALYRQAEEIALRLKEQGVEVEPGREIIAVIAYLQRLGVDIKTK